VPRTSALGGVDVDLRHVVAGQGRHDPGAEVAAHRFGVLLAALEHAGHELLVSCSCDERGRSLGYEQGLYLLALRRSGKSARPGVEAD
jgi:hypothetical protein